jgi:hypothetical protein
MSGFSYRCIFDTPLFGTPTYSAGAKSSLRGWILRRSIQPSQSPVCAIPTLLQQVGAGHTPECLAAHGQESYFFSICFINDDGMVFSIVE